MKTIRHLRSNEQAPAEEVELSLQIESLRKAISALPESEREIVELRYGITGDEPKTITELVEKLGIPRGSVRKMEKRALERLARARELVGLGSPPEGISASRHDER
jgi:RNA polymerase primary sigma factor